MLGTHNDVSTMGSTPEAIGYWPHWAAKGVSAGGPCPVPLDVGCYGGRFLAATSFVLGLVHGLAQNLKYPTLCPSVSGSHWRDLTLWHHDAYLEFTFHQH